MYDMYVVYYSYLNSRYHIVSMQDNKVDIICKLSTFLKSQFIFISVVNAQIKELEFVDILLRSFVCICIYCKVHVFWTLVH